MADGVAFPGETTTEGIPVIDLNKVLNRGDSEEAENVAKEEAKRCAEAFHRFGIIVLRDPRVSMADNDRFLDMLEDYFAQPRDTKMEDVREDKSFQVGTTPDFTELPRNHCDRMLAYKDADKPLSECPPEKDAKWRFFWRMGERPTDTEFAELNAEAVIPEKFPQWREVMDTWGNKLLTAVTNVAEIAAEGFGLESDALTSRMKYGPHLLAPTATDFEKHGKKGTICAGYHVDLNLFTIHGRSRFPGLYIWTREGNKVLVRVPEGCLLVQAGLQAEYLTGGHVLAGFHEVVVVDETLPAIERQKAKGRPLWRISSTLFSHIATDQTLQPLAHFAESKEALEKYPPIKAGAQVKRELAAISLSGTAK